VRRAIEIAVGEELRIALAARPYERKGGRRGYRNGRKTRTVTGPTGPLPLTLPRATIFRPGGAHEWQSTIVPRYARRAREVNAAVVATYLAGTNTRRIRGALAPLLKGAPLSKSAVSRVVATLRESLQTWMTRSLADVDGIVLYLDAIALRVRSAGRVVSLPVLGAVGVLPDGRKQLLALECCGGESAAAWHGFVEDLARRGLAAPLLCIIDGNPGLRRALAEIWPTALVQRCCVHKLRNLERKAPKHALGELRDDFHRIVYAANGDTARAEVITFRAQVGEALSRRRAQPAGRGPRAPDLLHVPAGPMEDAADHERHRTVERRISPPRQDTERAALGGHGRRLALQPRGERADPAAPHRRLAQNRRRAPSAGAGRRMTHRAQPHSVTISRAPISQLPPKPGGDELHAIVVASHREIVDSLFHITRDTTRCLRAPH
jgi:transposase-like protein